MEQKNDFTVEAGLNIQSAQLNRWKSILKPHLFKKLHNHFINQNSIATYKTGYDIPRGSSIDNWVSNNLMKDPKVPNPNSKALKSKKQLFAALEEINPAKYKNVTLDDVGNETYGRKSCIYIGHETASQRLAVDNELRKRGFKVSKTYNPGGSTGEVQVSYFKGWHWDE
jgi:hypothetical protein